jgi:predicted phage terminase large subunit-like protein
LQAAAKLSPAQLATLTPAQLATIAREARRAELGSTALLDLIPRVTTTYQRPKHLAKLAALFDRINAGERVRALVFAPPRHGKSETILHGLAQHLCVWPSHLVAYLSFGAEFAQSQSVKARDYAATLGWEPHARLDGKGDWRNVDLGGFLAYGILGPVMGRGFHVLVVDDPHRNRIEAESPRLRRKVLDQFKGTLLQRMEPNGSIIVTHQRWHDEDLIGVLKDEGGWEVIELPAVQSVPDPNNAERSIDVPLWPERYDLKAFAELRANNEYNWWSQFMGSPRPRGGAVFKQEPLRFEGSGREGRRIVLSVDGAGTESTRADYTAAVALAISGDDAEATCNVVDMVRVQLEPQDSAKVLRDFQTRNGDAPFIIESTRDGKAIEKALKTIDRSIGIQLVPPVGDKFIRAQPWASAWNGGRVAVPADSVSHPWVADLLGEHRTFTGYGDKHDDIVDACSQGWNHASAPLSEGSTFDGFLPI